MAQHPHHRQRSSLHEALVGARNADRVRAYIRSSSCRFSRSARQGRDSWTNVPGCSCHRPCDRRRAAVGAQRTLGKGRRRARNERGLIGRVRRVGRVGRAPLALLKERHMHARSFTIFAAIAATSILLTAAQQPAQQAPARGGGFRQPDPIDFAEHAGWTPLFDGKTLNGWSGDSNWKVEDGAIVIESTCEKPTGTIYLVWQGGEAADFELKMEMKGTGTINGGVQYRGWITPPAQRAGGAGPARGGPQPPCPSGAARGTPPDRMTEAKWNMAGAQYDFDAGNRY